MKLIHFTDQPLTEIRYLEQDTERLYKPTGFWVSDEDAAHSWRVWCDIEGFNLDRFKYAYEIHLAENHNVRILTEIHDIKHFSEGYLMDNHRLGRFALDWLAVRRDYDGLIITPYQWDLRLDLDYLWYNLWDCASGCIWNPAAIERYDSAIL